MVDAPMSDTSREARRIQLELIRRAPGWRKLELAAQLHQSLRMLALAGLRERHPGASPEALRRRLADLLLGPDLAKEVYGPLPNDL